MTITRWAQYHTRSLLFVLALLVLGGVGSLASLPVGLLPQVSFPRVRIALDAGDRPAERMVIEVTQLVEEAVRAIPGVLHLRSTTSRGAADIAVDFVWGQDMLTSTLQVESQVNTLRPSLPPGTRIDVRRMDPTVFPVIAYSLTSDTHSLVELRDLALYTLRPLLATVTGVGQVGVQGGAVKENQIVVDPGKLQAFGMSLSDVATKLAAANVLVAVGRLEDHDKFYLVVSDTRVQGLQQLNQTILRSGPHGVVRLDDVALVQNDTAPQYTRVTADGHDAVLVSIYQQPGGNTVQIAHDIAATLQAQAHTLPQGVRMVNWYDQSQLILAAEASVRDAIAIGVGLAALVLLLFLRNWTVTGIAVLAVPSVLVATTLLLSLMHMSLNMMTLGGMAAAVGLIIDDTIVMLEHLMRRLRQEGGAASETVVHAASEFTRPLASSSLSTIIIFAPLAFLSGVTGAFFKALSLTMAAGLALSFVVAWLAVPLVAAHWLGSTAAAPTASRPHRGRCERLYRVTLRHLLRPAWVVLLLVTPLGVLGTAFS